MSEPEFVIDRTRVEDVEECEGKTIESAMTLGDDKIGFFFADGTYLLCEAVQGYQLASLSTNETIELDDAHRFGLIDADEVKRIEDAREAKARAAREAGEREIYKRLRAVYEAEFGSEFRGV